MRILIAADTYYPNLDGASYFTQRLAKRLTLRGHEVLVIAPSISKKSVRTTHDGVALYTISSWPSLFHGSYRFCPPLFLKKRITPIFEEFNPDVVHIQGHFFIEHAVATVAREHTVPVLGTNHFMPENLLHYLPLPTPLVDVVRRLMWHHFKRLFNTLPLVTTPTKTAAQILEKIGLTGKIIPISCGIDTRKFSAHLTDPTLSARYRLPDEPILLCVNRLAPEKHVDSILRAVREARSTARFHFVVVGTGNERANLEKMAGELDIKKYVTFVGAVPDSDLPHFYALAKVFVMAGTAELQSLVTMEAMASGLPVIAADALALPELVRPGENGFLFKPGDTSSLATAITRLFSEESLHAKMAKKSLELISAHDETVTIEKFEKLYTWLLKNNPHKL